MPELPEVETTRRGIEPHVTGRRVVELAVHEPRLRWPVRANIASIVRDTSIVGVRRRAKYLLIDLDCDHAMVFDIGGGSSELIWLDLDRRQGYWRRSLADRLDAHTCLSGTCSSIAGR